MIYSFVRGDTHVAHCISGHPMSVSALSPESPKGKSLVLKSWTLGLESFTVPFPTHSGKKNLVIIGRKPVVAAVEETDPEIHSIYLLPLPDWPTVSEVHVKVVLRPTGFAIWRCASTNGTAVGRLQKGQEKIESDDLIRHKGAKIDAASSGTIIYLGDPLADGPCAPCFVLESHEQ